MCRHTAVRRRAAHTKFGALTEALACRVVRQDLGVGAAVLDQRGEFQEREHVVAHHRQLGPAGPTVHHQQRLGVVGQPEERLLAAEPALPQVGAGHPAERGTDARGYHAQDDVAHVVIHGRAW
ncbi:hypothetical protein GCM10027074_66450 [Streptomyces deserti]